MIQAMRGCLSMALLDTIGTKGWLHNTSSLALQDWLTTELIPCTQSFDLPRYPQKFVDKLDLLLECNGFIQSPLGPVIQHKDSGVMATAFL